VNKDTLPILSAQDWALLADHMRRVEYPRGAAILAEGSYHHRALHVVRSGTVRVEQAQDGRGIALALLGPDEIFGEVGFVEHAPGSASVIAQDDTVIDAMAPPCSRSWPRSRASPCASITRSPLP